MPEKFNINDFLRKAISIGASDVHLRTDERPVVRKDGRIMKIDMPKLTEDDIDVIINTLVPKNVKTKAMSVFDLDFSYEIKGLSRFRVNLSRQLNKSAIVIRNVPYVIKNIQELKLPISMEQFASLNNGLVLVTGPTGSGKSTTLASLIDYININYPKHIITIEDPIEFVFTSKKSIISQRQVGIDTPSFPEGVKYAMRQDPDVILIGEIRDKETIESALKAAETGHLVFATLHTNDAVQTINRIVNIFDPQDRHYVRSQIAGTLRGTIAQKLINNQNGEGRHPACEILVCTSTVKDFIIKDELEQIYDLVKKGSFNDMLTMNMSLFRLYEKGIASEEEVLSKSDNKNELQQMIKGVFHGTKDIKGRFDDE
ncbi:MAG: PilT/PilU family type 4a pilus ATPase [Candidatus Gastranaerophilales bacterium]|nr:PilT/PilU family type 4a pilus ATPase [Candidatus Gastranaerophilales bacterium]